MAKRESKKKSSTPGSGYQKRTTLREENSGRKNLNVKRVKNAKSVLKVQHLQKLATWAGGKASIPPLAALFGHRLAATADAVGFAPDSSLYSCERCETILQPGYNCTVRIEKNTAKRRQRKKLSIPSQNNVVYTCHFCSHLNLIRGTPKGHMKDILASGPKPISVSKPVGAADQKLANFDKDRDTTKEIIFLKASPISESNSGNPEKGQAIGVITTKNSPVTPFGKAPKDHMKEMLTSRPKPISVSKPVGSADQKLASFDKDRDTTKEIIFLKANPILGSNFGNPKKGQAISEITTENSPVIPFGKAPKDHMKEILTSKPKTISVSKSVGSEDQKLAIFDKDRDTTNPISESNFGNPEKGEAIREITTENSPVTPFGKAPKDHMEEILSSRPKSFGSVDQKLASFDKDRDTTKEIIILKANPISESNSGIPEKGQEIRGITTENSPVTPFGKMGIVLPENSKNSALGSSMTIRADNNSSTTTDTGKAKSGSSKRKRKGWSSLKQIAENSERENARRINNLTIPFFL